MLKKFLAVVFIFAFFLGGAVFAQENTVPELGELDGIFNCESVAVARSLAKDGATWTIVIVRGREAKKLIEEWEGKNTLIFHNSKIIIFLDPSIGV